jgi:hypothetical protein
MRMCSPASLAGADEAFRETWAESNVPATSRPSPCASLLAKGANEGGAATMKVLCELFGHWPGVLTLRRREGHWTCRCWLCETRLVRDGGAWGEPST